MLIETFDYAVTNRDKILSQIDFEKHEATIRRAKGRWTEFEPVEKEGNLVGIDSSWNFIPYQGFYIYAVDAVSMRGNGSYLVPPDFDVDLSTLTVQLGEEFVSSPALALESVGMEYEFNQARACVGKADLVIVDGSILARYYDRKRKKEGSFYEYAKELMKEKTLLFLSKMSFSNITLDGALGDMFYYNKASSKPGYSEPHVDPSGVTISYVRLAEYSPCVKLEIPGENKADQIEELMGSLKEGSVEGYPYVLRLAHEKGKISREEMEKLANLLGLNTEIGGRQVLGE
jgi:DNA double-strand break repair nuclease NurA